VNYDNTRFFPMLKAFGRLRLIKSKDFIYAMALSILFATICDYSQITRDVISGSSLVLVTIGAALVAVIITGLAILVSTSDDDFVRILKNAGIYENVLFPFWLSAILSGFSIIINIIAYLSVQIVKPNLIINLFGIALNDNHTLTFVLFLSFLSTFYALFSVIALIENAIKYGLYRGAFIEGRQENQGPT
jgi:hypothetical protein